MHENRERINMTPTTPYDPEFHSISVLVITYAFTLQ